MPSITSRFTLLTTNLSGPLLDLPDCGVVAQMVVDGNIVLL
ncbi:MAG: hypothetical protein R2857_12775 [Vampirovibrionales bacterium]